MKPEEYIMVYKIFNIEWDKEGTDVELPNELLWQCEEEYDIARVGRHELCFYIGYPVKKFSFKSVVLSWWSSYFVLAWSNLIYYYFRSLIGKTLILTFLKMCYELFCKSFGTHLRSFNILKYPYCYWQVIPAGFTLVCTLKYHCWLPILLIPWIENIFSKMSYLIEIS